MPDKTWKATERAVAALFGTVRNSLSGMGSKQTASDSLHPSLFVEVKYRKRHAVWALWADTKVKAKKEKKTPVVVLKEHGKQGLLIACHSDDFLTVAEEIRKAKEDVQDAGEESGG